MLFLKKYLKFFFTLSKYLIVIICTLLILFIALINITPIPISFYIRNEFEKGLSTKPINYDSYVNRTITIQNLTYPSKYKDNKADLYLPKEGANHPIIVWVHGGAFVGGDKKDAAEYSTILSSKGYAVLSVNYERAPELKYPNQLKQLDEIYDYILSISKEHSLDINNFFLAGDSAGAHLISQYTLIQSSKDYSNKMKFEQKIPISNIKGLLLYCGPFNVEKLSNVSHKLISLLFSQSTWAYFGSRNWEKLYGEIATIKYHINDNFPPTFITDGNKGSFEDHAKELIETFKEKNIPYFSYFIPKEIPASHEYQFKLHTSEAMNSINYAIDFLETYKFQ